MLGPVDYSRIFVSWLSLALVALAIIIFGTVALVQVAMWFGQILGWKKPAPARQMAMPPLKAGAGVPPGMAPARPIVIPGEMEAVKKEAVNGEEEAPCEVEPGEIVRITARKAGSRLEFFDEGGKRLGFALPGSDWNGAMLGTVYMKPNEERAAAEARPLKVKDVGALCSIVDPVTGAEIAMVGTIFMKPEWHGAPKPIYDTAGNLLAEFRGVEAHGGLASARICASSGKTSGKLFAKGGNEWLVEFAKDARLETRVLMLAIAQLVWEQSR